MLEASIILGLAFLLDLLIGDPSYAYHPIRLIGRAVQVLENRIRLSGRTGRSGGVLLTALLIMIISGLFISFSFLLTRIYSGLGQLWNLYLCYSCLAFKDLIRHCRPVAQALDRDDIVAAREHLSRVVGRDVLALGQWGIGRATVETLAENFVDGFLSPVFWFVVFALSGHLISAPPVEAGVLGMLLFKAASTLDSMIGYKDEKYLYFGWAGARLDDLMNFIPARLALFILFVGAALARLKPRQGLKIALRDRLKHPSPNAAHAESFAAGALGIRLGGPVLYPDGLEEKPWLGDGPSEVSAVHIQQTMKMLSYSAWFTMAIPGSTYLFYYIFR